MEGTQERGPVIALDHELAATVGSAAEALRAVVIIPLDRIGGGLVRTQAPTAFGTLADLRRASPRDDASDRR